MTAGEDSVLLAAALRQFDLFAGLSEEQLAKVLYFVKAVEFDAGETVFEKGNPARASM